MIGIVLGSGLGLLADAVVVECEVPFGDAEQWGEVSRLYRQLMGLALARKSGQAEVNSQRRSPTVAKEREVLGTEDNEAVFPDFKLAAMLRC